MVVSPEIGISSIVRLQPEGKVNSITSQSVLDKTTEVFRRRQDIKTLAEYLTMSVRRDRSYQMHWFSWDLQTGVPFEEALERWNEISLKPRGSEGGREDLNSHFEEFIIEDGDEIKVVSLQDLARQLVDFGFPLKLLGLASIGNRFQMVTAVVQGIDWDNPKSGNERPILGEGPHMVLDIHAFDQDGNLHILRTVQMRKGEAVIDTVRGFADQKVLEGGEQMYKIDGAGERIKTNITRVIGEEAGKQLLKIKSITYLGAPVPNTTFVDNNKKSAMFAVEVDYDHFIECNKVITEDEFQRRREQFEHEGLTGVIIDMTLEQYVNHVRNSALRTRDLTADTPSNMVVIDFLWRKLGEKESRFERSQSITKKQIEFWKYRKRTNPQGHLEEMAERSRFLKAKRAEVSSK